MDAKKRAIMDALWVFVAQRPGLEFGNYGDVRAYRSEVRRIGRQLQQARTLLRAVEWRDGITGDALLKAFRAYSGRLTCKVEEPEAGRYRVALDYCTGQYWPTEYRAAVCAVASAALWGALRDSIPNEGRDGVSPGDLMRRHFRREFGRGIQAAWLD